MEIVLAEKGAQEKQSLATVVGEEETAAPAKTAGKKKAVGAKKKTAGKKKTAAAR
jgi:hypothetical protein